MNKHVIVGNVAPILLFSLPAAGTIVAGTDMTASRNIFVGTWASLINEEYIRLTPTNYYRIYVMKTTTLNFSAKSFPQMKRPAILSTGCRE